MDNQDITDSIVPHQNLYDLIISKENLLISWQEFKVGKKEKLDVKIFDHNLAENLINLHDELKTKSYRHGHYTSFYVQDPKLRHIHKASVRDRVLHHAIIRTIEPIFEKTFIIDSYSSRKVKGTHKAILRLRQFAWKLSRNNTITVWVLKCDIRKYFDSIDHQIIFNLLRAKIDDLSVLRLLKNIIESYSSRLDLLQSKSKKRRGMPLGNLTSQLFSNIYLNPLDQFVKHKLREKYYIRYADDFLIISRDKVHLIKLISIIKIFIENVLKLELHPNKIELRKWSRGIDFLGYISFPHHTVLRTKTKQRMIRKIKHNIHLLSKGKITKETFNQSTQSYLGLLKHCRSFSIYQKILKLIKC